MPQEFDVKGLCTESYINNSIQKDIHSVISFLDKDNDIFCQMIDW